MSTVCGAVVALMLGCAACGGTADADPVDADPAQPRVVEPAPTVTARDATGAGERRIVPVDGDIAEIVFALGFGDQVVATDISATYPAAADALPDVGYQRALAPEPIAAFDPTLVLATDLAGPDEALASLERLGIETVVIERTSTPAGPGDKIRAVGAALDAEAAADELAAEVDARIAAQIERATDSVASPRIGVLYLRGENVQLLLGEGSGVDWLIEAAGAVDIADELGVVDHVALNTEALVEAAPDVLIVPERGIESVGGLEGLLAIPGIAETPAGTDERILVYDDQYLLGNGPRTGDLLDELITDIHGDNR